MSGASGHTYDARTCACLGPDHEQWCPFAEDSQQIQDDQAVAEDERWSAACACGYCGSFEA